MSETPFLEPTQNHKNGYIQDVAASEDTFTQHSIGDFFRSVLHNWLWIVLAVLICFTIGYIYLACTPRTYERSAMILVKNEGGQNSVLSELSQLSFSGNMASPLKGNQNLENEMLILRTERVIAETVNRLNLDVVYYDKRGLRKENIYKDRPVEVTFEGVQPNSSLRLQLQPEDAATYRIKSFSCSESKECVKNQVKRYGEVVETPSGNFVVTSTPNFGSFESIGTLYISKIPERTAVLHYLSSLSVTPASKQSSVLKMQLRSSHPDLASDFLNTLVQIHKEQGHADRLQIGRSTHLFIDNRLSLISRELGEVDSEIESFKQNNQIADMQTEAQEYIRSTGEISRTLIDLNNQLSVAQMVKSFLKKNGGSHQLIPSGVGLEDAVVTSQIAQYNSILLKRQELVANSGEGNPLLLTLDEQLHSVRASVVQSVDNLISALNIKRKALEREQNANADLIASVPARERIVGDIYRQQKIKEELYLFLLSVREKNLLGMEATESDIRLIQPATGGSSPVAPKVPFVLLTSVFMGLLLSLGVIYLRLITDNKVRGRKDIDRYVTVPFLGEIPHYYRTTNGEPSKASWKQQIEDFVRGKQYQLEKSNAWRSQRTFAVGHGRRSMLSESFTVVRTNLSFMLPKHVTHGQTLMVISAIPNSGKSFICSNLSLSIAKTGKKVLMLDLDVRKGSLSNAVSEIAPFNSKGMTGYLANDNLTADDVIVSKGLPQNLFCIPAGIVPPNPAELLLSDRLDALIEELRSRFDYIVIDTPPFVGLADSRIINRVVDSTICVVREGLLPRQFLTELEQIYHKKTFNNLSILLNDAGSSITSKQYGYGKYGGYYGYGKYVEGYFKESEEGDEV